MEWLVCFGYARVADNVVAEISARARLPAIISTIARALGLMLVVALTLELGNKDRPKAVSYFSDGLNQAASAGR